MASTATAMMTNTAVGVPPEAGPGTAAKATRDVDVLKMSGAADAGGDEIRAVVVGSWEAAGDVAAVEAVSARAAVAGVDGGAVGVAVTWDVAGGAVGAGAGSVDGVVAGAGATSAGAGAVTTGVSSTNVAVLQSQLKP